LDSLRFMTNIFIR